MNLLTGFQIGAVKGLDVKITVMKPVGYLDTLL